MPSSTLKTKRSRSIFYNSFDGEPIKSSPWDFYSGGFIIFGHSIYLMEIGAEKTFQKDSGDGTPCVSCKEPIFGYRYILIYEVLGESLESKIQLCESCYELLKVEPTRR